MSAMKVSMEYRMRPKMSRSVGGGGARNGTFHPPDGSWRTLPPLVVGLKRGMSPTCVFYFGINLINMIWLSGVKLSGGALDPPPNPRPPPPNRSSFESNLICSCLSLMGVFNLLFTVSAISIHECSNFVLVLVSGCLCVNAEWSVRVRVRVLQHTAQWVKVCPCVARYNIVKMAVYSSLWSCSLCRSLRSLFNP